VAVGSDSSPLRRPWSDRRAERAFGTVAVSLLVLIAAMVVFVVSSAWPAFEANGLRWFGSGGSVDAQLADLYNADPDEGPFTFRAWPLLYGTALVTGFAVVVGLALALLSAIFICEFAPPPLRRVMPPVVKLLAAVPSVVYGLIGILVLAPFVQDALISPKLKEDLIFAVQISGQNLLVAGLILTVMITPIMTALIVEALRSVPRSWTEGSAALGVNRWRTMWRISVRAARPAIVAAAVLATARALGEAIMLSMVSGSISFAPNPLDGLTMLVEPVHPVAAVIAENRDGLSTPIGPTIYAMASVLLVASAGLSFAAWAVKQPMKRFGVRP
jgi:phosphate transport system permease protein